MDTIASPCQAQGLGTSNQIFGLLLQTILATQCSISPPSMWPKDQLSQGLENGKILSLIIHMFSLHFKNFDFDFQIMILLLLELVQEVL